LPIATAFGGSSDKVQELLDVTAKALQECFAHRGGRKTEMSLLTAQSV